MKLLVHVLIYIVAVNCYASNKLFKPLEANPIEARIGTIYQANTDKLRLDIGNSFDLLNVKNDEKMKINLGGDFMTFTRLRSVGRFKFPVETTDYYFGINSTMNFQISGINLESRIRLGHISSHLIDGYTEDWEFLKDPFVYSREFLDIVIAYRVLKEFRIYIGSNVVFSRLPKDLGIYEFQTGFDFQKDLTKKIKVRGGYDFKTKPINNNVFSQNACQIGLFFPSLASKGTFMGYYFYNGRSIRGMFFNDHDNYHSFGIQVYY